MPCPPHRTPHVQRRPRILQCLSSSGLPLVSPPGRTCETLGCPRVYHPSAPECVSPVSSDSSVSSVLLWSDRVGLHPAAAAARLFGQIWAENLGIRASRFHFRNGNKCGTTLKNRANFPEKQRRCRLKPANQVKYPLILLRAKPKTCPPLERGQHRDVNCSVSRWAELCGS